MEDVSGGGVSGPAGVVRGEVRGPDGTPVAGARVVVTASPVPVPEIAAVTDTEGRFALSAPAPGRYTLTAHAEGTPGKSAAAAVTVASPPGWGDAATPPADPDVDVGNETDEAHAPALPAATVEVHLVITLADGIDPPSP